MQRAWTLTTYYLQNALRSAQVAQVEMHERSAIEVLDWLKSQQGPVIRINEIQKKIIPSKYRKSVVFIRTTMEYLTSSGHVTLAESNNKNLPSAWRVIA